MPSDTPAFSSLKHKLLIAMPQLNDSWFDHTVTYICDHNEDGAMGLVLNKKSGLNLNEVLEQLDIEAQWPAEESILEGGPVSPEHGFILHKEQGQWDSTLSVENDVHITTSKDILRSLAEGTGPLKHKVALGYAGWEAGQLEQEMLDNAWLTIDADDTLLFDTPNDQIYQQALATLGIDETFLSSDAGHA